MGILCGYLVGTLWPNFMSASNPGPVFMMMIAIVFSFGDRLHRAPRHKRLDGGEYRHQRDSDHGAGGVRHDGAGYRSTHPPGSVGYQFDSTSGDAYNYEFATTKTVANGADHRDHRARRGRNPQAAAGRGRQARAVPDRLSG